MDYKTLDLKLAQLLFIVIAVGTMSTKLAAQDGWIVESFPTISPNEADTYFNTTASQKQSEMYVGEPPNPPASAAAKATVTDPTADLFNDKISSDITELARGLQNDPIRIYDFVRNRIAYEPYFGSMKGATMALRDQSANDADQASLLIALLQEAGFAAEYVYGTMTIPMNGGVNNKNLISMLGIEPSTTLDDTLSRVIFVLANGGIPIFNNNPNAVNEPFPCAAQICPLTISRIWVRAQISGTSVDLDPAFKTVSAEESQLDIGQESGFNKAALLLSAGGTVTTPDNRESISNLSILDLENNLENYTTNLLTSVRSTFYSDSPAEVVGLYKTVQEPQTTLPSDVAFPHTEIATWTEIPAQFLHTIRLEVGGIRETVATKSYYGKKLAVHFEGGANLQEPHPQILCSAYNTQPLSVSRGSLHQSGSNIESFPLCPGENGQTVTYQVDLLDSGNGVFELLDSSGNSHQSLNFIVGSGQTKFYRVRFKGFDETQSTFLPSGLKQGQVKVTITNGAVVFDASNPRSDAIVNLTGTIIAEPKAVITLDDEPILDDDIPTYTNSVETFLTGGGLVSTRSRLKMAIDHPYASKNGTAADQDGRYALKSNGDYVAGLSFGDISRSRQTERRKTTLQKLTRTNSSATAQEILRESLYIMGLTWLDQTSKVGAILNGAAQQRVQSHHRFGMLGQVEGYFIDFRHQISSLSNRVASSPNNEAVFRANSFFSSALEHGVLEQLQGSDRKIASTISVIANAVEQGQAINYYDDFSSQNDIDSLTNGGYSVGFVNARASEIASGFFDFLLIPAQRSQINQFTGEGFVNARAITPTTSGQILMGISGDSIDGTLGGGFPTTTADVDSGFISADSVLEFTESSVGFSTSSISCGPVNFNTGDKLESMTDLSAGGVLFSRFYNSSNYLQDSGLGKGWRHSLDISIGTHSDENSSLGGRAVSDMTPILVAQHAISELLANQGNNGQPSSEEWAVAALVANWAIKQLQDNAVTIRTSQSGETFIRMPDGSYNSPPQNTSSLTTVNGNFVLSGRFGTVTDFNSDDKISSVTDIDGNAIIFSYVADRLDRVDDSDSHFVQLTYIGDRLDKVQDHTSREVSFDYEGDLLRFVTDVENKIWEYQYDGDQRLFRRINPLQQTIKEIAYDSMGRVETQTWPRSAGNASESYFYGDYSTTVVDPLAYIRETDFDEHGRTRSTRNAMGESTSRQYDGQSRIVLSKNRVGRETLFNFNENNDITSLTNTAFEITNYDYDASLRLEFVTDPLGNKARTQYDAKNHPTVTTSYPAQNELISVSTTYYADGRVDEVTDARGAVTKNTYDARRNPDTQFTSYTDESGTVTTPVVDRDHDALGRLVKLTDQEGAETVLTYDNRNNIDTITDPTSKVTDYDYDDVGRLERITDRNGDISEIDYTISGQVEKVTYPNLSENVEFTYDLRDQVETMTDSIGISTFDYDALGRLYDVEDANGFTVGYRYNTVGLLEKLIYPDGKEVTYTYDAANRLKTVTNWLAEVITYYYDLAGRIDYVENANGTITDYTFDNANRLTRLANKKSDGSVISEQVYKLDANGNPESEFRIQPQAPQEIAVDLSYDYNAERTRLESIINEDDNSTIETFTYDDEGQQVGKGSDARLFDTRHRLTQQGNKAYEYDGNNNRLKVTDGTTTRYFIYDSGNNLIAEASGRLPTNIDRYYVYGAGLKQMVVAGVGYTYHSSPQGHTLAITDDLEVIQNQYAYSPFGRILGITEATGLEQPFKYVGKFGVQHEQNDIYYMRARYYDAKVGRFLKEDPIGIEGGMNVSLYAGSNPIVSIDPNGLESRTARDIERQQFQDLGIQDPLFHSGTHASIYAEAGSIAGVRRRRGPISGNISAISSGIRLSTDEGLQGVLAGPEANLEAFGATFGITPRTRTVNIDGSHVDTPEDFEFGGGPLSSDGTGSITIGYGESVMGLYGEIGISFSSCDH